MNIAIVDDIAAERALLRSRLERQLSRRNIQANLLEYDTGEAFLSSCAKLQFAVLFLDIYMDGVNGIEKMCIRDSHMVEGMSIHYSTILSGVRSTGNRW